MEKRKFITQLIALYPAYVAKRIKEEAKGKDEETCQGMNEVANMLANINDITSSEEFEHLKEAVLENENINNEAKTSISKIFTSKSLSDALKGLRIQTHTQKHFNGNNNSWAYASYGKQGDLTAETVGISNETEVFLSLGASATSIAKTINLILSENKSLLSEVKNTISEPSRYDKALLYPLYNSRNNEDSKYQYIGVRPITPIWQLISQYKSLRQACASKLAESLNELKENHVNIDDKNKKKNTSLAIPTLHTRFVRAHTLSTKPLNNGLLMASIQGMMVQSIHLPPVNINSEMTTWIPKKWEYAEDVDIDAFINFSVYKAIKQSNLLNLIIHEKHKKYGKNFSDKEVPQNKHIKDGWFDLGQKSAEILMTQLEQIELTRKNEEVKEEFNAIKNDWMELQERSWNVLYLSSKLSNVINEENKEYNSTFKDFFNKGFKSEFFGKTETKEKPNIQSHDSPLNKRNKKENSENHIRIFLEVDAMNAGSYSPTIGITPLVGVWGALHSWFERDLGVSVNDFKLGAKELRLLDNVSKENGYNKSPVYANKSGKLSSTLQNKEVKITEEDVYEYIKGPYMNCTISQVSRTGSQSKSPSDISEPFVTEVKMSGKILLEVEIDGEGLNDIQKENLYQSIIKSRFNGGFIKSCTIDTNSSETIHGWYALSSVDLYVDNPLKEMFNRLIYTNVTKIQEKSPFGFVQTGWQFLDVEENHTIHRNGNEFKWRVAEPVWKTVRWLGWNNPSSTWWRVNGLESNTKGEAIGVTPV